VEPLSGKLSEKKHLHKGYFGENSAKLVAESVVNGYVVDQND